MKISSVTRLAAMVFLAASAWLSVACESKPATTSAPPAAASAAPADSTQPVVATAYVCPMACEGSASNAPGKCPVCEMTLEANPDFKPIAQ